MIKHIGTGGNEGGCRRWLPWIAALGILLLLLLNVGLAALLQYRSLYLDLTPEGLYSLSDGMKKECDKLKSKLTITFCDDPDRLLANAETRYVYVMATELASKYDNIKVETYNLTLNPTALDRFRVTSATTLSRDRVIISSGDRYRIYSASSFWVTNSEDTETARYWSFNGEYVMASAFRSLSLINAPVAYYVYNHGESYFVPETDTANAALAAGSDDRGAAFYGLLLKAGLRVGYLDLSLVTEIPEDCALLIMNGPKEDLASASDPTSYRERSESEVLDRYLAGGNGALMIFKDPDVTGLTNLTQLAEKWGISYEDGAIVRDTSALDGASGTTPLLGDKLISRYNEDDASYPYAIYKDVSTIISAPPVIVERSGAVKRYFRSNGTIVSGNIESSYVYGAFLTTSDGARLYAVDTGETVGEDGVYTLAALTARTLTDSYTTERYVSYFFAAATTALTENTYIDAGAYANHDVLLALVTYISGMDDYADIDLGSTSLNSKNVGGKRLQYSDLSATDTVDPITKKECHAFTRGSLVLWTVLIFVVPALIVPAVGIYVCVRRRYL